MFFLRLGSGIAMEIREYIKYWSFDLVTYFMHKSVSIKTYKTGKNCNNIYIWTLFIIVTYISLQYIGTLLPTTYDWQLAESHQEKRVEKYKINSFVTRLMITDKKNWFSHINMHSAIRSCASHMTVKRSYNHMIGDIPSAMSSVIVPHDWPSRLQITRNFLIGIIFSKELNYYEQFIICICMGP